MRPMGWGTGRSTASTFVVLIAGATALAACGGDTTAGTSAGAATPNPGPHTLTGTFRLTDGTCSASQSSPPTGSYFAMLSGQSLSGPFEIGRAHV